MLEFLSLCVAPVNLMFTVMLLGVVFYWAMFLSGTVGLDLFEGDVDLDVDVSPDLDLDVDVDVDADLGIDADGDMDLDAVTDGGGRAAGLFISLLRLVGVGDVPVMVVISAVIGSLWAISILTSHYFNPSLTWILALLWFGPNLIVALLLTRFITWPASYIFRRSNMGIAKPTKIVGRPCTITTSTVTDTFGQAEFVEGEVPVTLNVRLRVGSTDSLSKGDEAIVLEYEEDKNTYIVCPFDLEVN